ncbi:MAG: GNAT family N-acetyltransferase [Solirubrobacterales bacterium]
MPERGHPIEVSTHTAIAPLEREWEELARGAPPFLQPGWISTWWRAFGRGEPVILCVRRDGDLAGVLPLMRRDGVLESAANWHTPVFGAVTLDRPAGATLARALFDLAPRRVRLGFLAGDAPFLHDLRGAARAAGYQVAERVMLRPPYVEVSGDWQRYWSTRSRNLRKGVKRRRNRLQELGQLELEIASGDDGLERLEEAFQLEASGWKGERGTAIVSRPETRRFYEEVARWAAETGMLRIVTLRLNDRAVAMHLSIEAGDDYFTLKVGYDPEFEKAAPSKLLDREMLEHAFNSRLSSFEFLGDADPYKLDWSDQQHERVELQAFARSPRGVIDRLVHAHGRQLARWALSLRRR